MNILRSALALGLALLLGSAGALPAQHVETEYEGAAALGLALRKLGVSKRVLMIAAHPDDESTQVLAALALGEGAEVAYLSLTRGEGGQNGIGPELDEALGLLRSEELLSARRLDGARQYFTRAYDFGFSRTAEETLRHWPRDSLLADVVAVMREFRPDIVVSIFTGTPLDGHGHHQVAGMMAREAFHAAADPRRFPEQLRRGLRPHTTPAYYHAGWRRAAEATHQLQSGVLDPLLGRSHFQVAMASRSRHRSQDMGRAEPPGPQASALERLDGPGPVGPSIWAGIDTLLSQRVPARSNPGRLRTLLLEYEARTAELRAGFNAFAPNALVPALAAALGVLDDAIAQASDGGGADAELLFRLREERRDAADALARAAGVVLDAITDAEIVVPGQSFTLTLRLWNGGTEPLELAELAPRLPAGWAAEPVDALDARLAPGELKTRRFRVNVPATAAPSEPYYLRRPRDGSMFRWPEGAAPHGAPFEAPELRAIARLRLSGVELAREREAMFLGVDKMVGEYRRPVRVVPAATLALGPEVLLLPTGRDERARLRIGVRVAAQHPGGVAGSLALQLPEGWRAPPARELRLGAGEARTFEFEVDPPAGTAAGQYTVGAVLTTAAGERYTRGFELVDYPHIRPRPLYREARARVTAADVRVAPNLRVGYIVGAGDDTPAALAQLGVRYDLLDAAALAAADLAAYHTIVIGIRAYEVRPDLAAQSARLHEFVRGGGTVIVQYNKYEFTEPGIAPYPLAMARPHGRVTDHTAPVRLLEPAHPLLSWPNRIGPADFGGWVQERGLYFLSEWDDRYLPLLEMADPGQPAQRGALVVARHGEGHYVYTGLALFRQLPAGVPGAYRLLANLISLGAAGR